MLLLHDQHVTSDLVSELQTVRALLRANGLVGCRWCATGGREHSATRFLAVHFVTQILAFADPQFVEVMDFTQATLLSKSLQHLPRLLFYLGLVKTFGLFHTASRSKPGCDASTGTPPLNSAAPQPWSCRKPALRSSVAEKLLRKIFSQLETFQECLGTDVAKRKACHWQLLDGGEFLLRQPLCPLPMACTS